MPTNPQQDYEAFESHLASGALRRAASVANRMLKAEPRGELATIAHARLAAARGNAEDAARYLASLDPAKNRLASAAAWLAFMEEKCGRHEQAEAMARASLDAGGLLPVARHVLGRACMRRGDHAGAVSAFRAVVTQVPSDVEAWQGLADALRAQGRTHAGAQALEHVAALRPDDAGPRAELAAALLAAGEAEHAHAKAMEALKRFPRHAELLRQVDRIRQARTTTTDDLVPEIAALRARIMAGDTEGCRDRVATLSRAHPASRTVMFLRAELAVVAGDDDAPTLGSLTGWVKEHPDAWEPRLLLALAQLRRGQEPAVTQASDHAEAAWAMSGGHPDAGLTLVRAYSREGRTTLAQAVATQLVSLDPALRKAADRALAG